jgi:bifunctional DNA-binding transcriptional regulator/antitoxin component of YhaV-PrlF toxin-antitoxin module
MSTIVGEKGQITIEKHIRRALGIAAGWRACQTIEDGRVVVSFVPPKHNRSLAGVLRASTTVRIETEDEFRRAAEGSWLVTDQQD